MQYFHASVQIFCFFYAFIDNETEITNASKIPSAQ